MKPLAIAALLFASVAHAQGAYIPSMTALVVSQTADDDEAEGTSGDNASSDADEAATSADPAAPAGQAAASASGPSATTSSAANPRAQELVSGAPLYNPNVAVHIVQRKQFSDKGRHELTLYPVLAPLNGKFTEHFGSALGYTYHFHENFGFQVTPLFNWSNQQSPFNAELIEKARLTAEPATSLLLNWGALAGVEVTPIYGKFAWYDDTLAQFSLVLTGGAGYGTTRLQLKDANNAGPATFGDAGGRFLGSVGAGFRVQLGDRWAIRMEVRDVVYTARVDNVNGCSVEDLGAMDAALRRNEKVTSVKVGGSCRVAEFDGKDENGYNRTQNVPLAYDLVREPTSDVLNLVNFYGGVSFLF